MDTLSRNEDAQFGPAQQEMILHEQRRIQVLLEEGLAAAHQLRDDFRAFVRQQSEAADLPLLAMAEGLIAAHRAAKIDGDGYTLDLIEDALFHIGKRLKHEGPGDMVPATLQQM